MEIKTVQKKGGLKNVVNNKGKSGKSNNSELFERDCIEGMKELEDDSIHAVITDPPYGLEFMGKDWDAPWKYNKMDKLSFAKEGSNPLPSFNSTRNSVCRKCHKLERGKNKCTCEEPDFDKYDRILEDKRKYQQWVTDWATEAFRVLKPGGYLLSFGGTRTYHRMTCGIEDAGFEIRDCIMWVYGSGFPKGLNIGKAVDKLQGNEREVVGDSPFKELRKRWKASGEIYEYNKQGFDYSKDLTVTKGKSKWEGWNTNLKPAVEPIVMARKPFKGSVVDNVLQHDVGGINVDACRIDYANNEPDSRVNKNDIQKGASGNPFESGNNNGDITTYKDKGRYPSNVIIDEFVAGEIDNERFFYVPKVSADERNMGCDNNHPTVKPLELMRYLVKMVTQEGHTVLDPFAGSGSTLIACKQLGRDYIGFEKDPDYVKIANARLKAVVTLRDWF